MDKIYLISEDYVKTNVSIDENLYTKYLNVAIREAQDMRLEPVLGTALYRAILDKVSDGSIVDDNVYKGLLDNYIQPFLLYATMERIIPLIANKIANSGVVVTDDEKNSNVVKNERDSLVKYYTSTADYYCERLQDFLYHNSNAFPELFVRDDGKYSNIDSASSCGIWLGGERGRIRRYCR